MQEDKKPFRLLDSTDYQFLVERYMSDTHVPTVQVSTFREDSWFSWEYIFTEVKDRDQFWASVAAADCLILISQALN